nr:hypothetical protein [Tanacetum cinerariifolium]
MMASFFQMKIASTSGSGLLLSNTITNLKGELKAITTRSGIVLDGSSIPIPPPFINPEEDERVEETLTDQDLVEYTIKVPPPLVQKPKPPSQRNFVMHQRDPLHPNIPYPSRMLKQKQQEKDEVQIHKFWQMFKQLHINITLDDAFILIPKYQKMFKAFLSNKEKLLELSPPAQYLVHKSLAASRRHVAASYWTAASDVAPTSKPVSADQRRSTPPVNDGQRCRSTTVYDAGHWSMVADHGGDRRSTVAVDDGRRWRTTVDCRWTTVDHHRSTV